MWIVVLEVGIGGVRVVLAMFSKHVGILDSIDAGLLAILEVLQFLQFISMLDRLWNAIRCMRPLDLFGSSPINSTWKSQLFSILYQ